METNYFWDTNASQMLIAWEAMQVIFVANELRCNGIFLASMVLVSFCPHIIFFRFLFSGMCFLCAAAGCWLLAVVFFLLLLCLRSPALHLLCDHWFLSHTIAHFDLLIEFYVTRNINCATRRCHTKCVREPPKSNSDFQYSRILCQFYFKTMKQFQM